MHFKVNENKEFRCFKGLGLKRGKYVEGPGGVKTR